MAWDEHVAPHPVRRQSPRHRRLGLDAHPEIAVAPPGSGHGPRAAPKVFKLRAWPPSLTRARAHRDRRYGWIHRVCAPPPKNSQTQPRHGPLPRRSGRQRLDECRSASSKNHHRRMPRTLYKPADACTPDPAYHAAPTNAQIPDLLPAIAMSHSKLTRSVYQNITRRLSRSQQKPR